MSRGFYERKSHSSESFRSEITTSQKSDSRKRARSRKSETSEPQQPHKSDDAHLHYHHYHPPTSRISSQSPHSENISPIKNVNISDQSQKDIPENDGIITRPLKRPRVNTTSQILDGDAKQTDDSSQKKSKEEEDDVDSASFKECAYMLLKREGKPLHINAIIKNAIDQGMIQTKGRTPTNTLASILCNSIKSKDTKFTKVGPGMTFGLKEWNGRQ